MKCPTKLLALGVLVAALSAPAHAASLDLNVYGASAQFTYWNAAAASFLTAAGRGCTATTVTTYTNAGDTTNNGKHEITQGTGCTFSFNGTTYDTINIRYSSKASYDGIRAVSNVDPANSCPGQAGYRVLITGAGNNTLTCQDVHLGASDVAGETFTQQSHGLLLGPLGGAQTDRVFNGIPTTGLTSYQPVVVPFGFFANSNIKVYKCNGGASDGNLCTVGTETADCGAPSLCQQRTIDNVTREMIVNIYSGNAVFWTDLGASYSVTGDASNAIVACLRHAGSGTLATFEKVFFTGANGANLAITENTAGPYIYFNDGSSDEMKCINNNSNLTTPGAIGFADADQSLSSYTSTVAVKYNGLLGRRNSIRNGAYDFFSNQWLYENPTKTPTATSPQHKLITDLYNYAKVPGNVPSGKSAYWATHDEMNFNKGTDSVYPVFVGAASPQIP